MIWITAGGLAKLAGLSRRMSRRDVAKHIGISYKALQKLADEHEEVAKALEMDGEMTDFLVEKVVLDKALAGEQKAYEFWLKRRGNEELGIRNEELKSVNYAALADLINK
ncbi:MAG: hypothetical protein FWE21_10365 [Defluviitaleaceae bacterium]|nr:hypothetical protein [Defluviitaleaceae bacterium]